MPIEASLRNLKPWRPGHSGNPGGRPKASVEVRALAKEHTAEAVAKLVEIMRSGKGDMAKLAAAVALLDRGWGRPAQAIAGPEGDPTQLEAGKLAEDFRNRLIRLAERGAEGVEKP